MCAVFPLTLPPALFLLLFTQYCLSLCPTRTPPPLILCTVVYANTRFSVSRVKVIPRHIAVDCCASRRLIKPPIDDRRPCHTPHAQLPTLRRHLSAHTTYTARKYTARSGVNHTNQISTLPCAGSPLTASPATPPCIPLLVTVCLRHRSRHTRSGQGPRTKAGHEAG